MEDLRENGMEAGQADATPCCGCHQKATPRGETELKQLKNRLSRMTGQLNGIGRMLEENRYCGDILNQVAAVESALQAFGYVILQDHMETCVVEEIKNGNTAIVDEAVELMKKLK
ncbi:MAG: metal-sensing transcriptional repressor [Blautia sp.]|nr:metal-sensing transcriptional repressor [Blautia sp.]